ncbi:MAG TPA: glycosyltransferase family 4 protein [Chloroflexi bacterium]|nr:glycosyltransferase family 4 protein [Chloroflexota bacterium]
MCSELAEKVGQGRAIDLVGRRRKQADMRVLLVTNMYPTPEEPAYGTFVRDQVEDLRRIDIEIDVLFINGPKHTLNYLWGVPRFWWQLLKKRYHLIHAHYAMSGFIARLQPFYPVVVTYHGGEVKDHVPRWLKIPARFGPWIFDRVIVVNHEEKEILNDHARVSVIPCGVDLEVFRPMPRAEARRSLELPPDKPLILWAGQYWQPEKRFELVEASVATLKRTMPEAELVVVSGQPHSVIPVHMNACDVFVFTSWSEGSPMVIKEAMACNLPIVSTDVGDVAEVIGGVEGCYLVEPDPEDVADKLSKVLQERQRTHGRERIKYFDSNAIARQIGALYHELCSKS